MDMQPLVKRQFTDNQYKIIYTVFTESYIPSSGIIIPQLHGKESEDYFIALDYFQSLLETTRKTFVHLESIVVNENNEIVYSNTLHSEPSHGE